MIPGLDPDGWRILLAAKYIAQHHVYVASRPPGFPIPEFALSLVSGYPPWVSITVTAVLSLCSVIVFNRILRTAQVRNHILLTIAFASTPLVIINSFTTMDYMWALAFTLVSFLLLLHQRHLIAGVMLGIAVGCRITSILMLLPFLYLIHAESAGRKTRTTESLKLLLAAIFVSGLCFVPVVWRYGLAFPKGYSVGNSDILNMLKAVTIDTFGLTGTVAIAAGLTVHFVRHKAVRLQASRRHREWRIVCLVVLGLYGILYAIFPLEAGYLIPTIAFLLLIFGLEMSQRALYIVAVGLLISPWILSLDAYDRPWSPSPSHLSIQFRVKGRALALDLLEGPLVHDFSKRIAGREYSERVLGWAHEQTDSAILVCGSWMPQLAFLSNREFRGEKEESFSVQKVTLLGLVEANASIKSRCLRTNLVYLPGQELYNKGVYGLDLNELGGRQLEMTRIGRSASFVP